VGSEDERPQTGALNFQLSAFKFQLSEEMTPGHFFPFPLNVARTMSTTRVTRMKSMRNLAMGI
jgi:hypothetical protein